MARGVAALGLLLALSVSGCARSDWIESTLVTAEIAGQWEGEMWMWRDQKRSPIELQLRQSGAKVSGTFAMGHIAVNVPARSTGQLEGSINGDVFRFSQVGGGLTGELTVGVDEMTGWLARPPAGGRLTAMLKRR